MHYRKKVISMQIIVRLLSSEDSTLLPPPSSCLRKFWVHFFLQTEGTNQMVMRYKIGTQPYSKSLTNLPTMPNKIWKYPPRGGGHRDVLKYNKHNNNVHALQKKNHKYAGTCNC